MQRAAFLGEVRDVARHRLAQDRRVLQVVGKRGDSLGHARLQQLNKKNTTWEKERRDRSVFFNEKGAGMFVLAKNQAVVLFE